MESGLVGEPLSVSGEGDINNNALSSITYTELFEEHLPFYLSIGMSYEDYWENDVFIAKSYRRAYDIQKERTNEQLWLQGLYVYQAIMAMTPALRPMSNSAPEKYMEEPLPLTETEFKKREKRREKRKQEEMIDKAERFASAFNKQIREQKKEEDDNAGSNNKQAKH